MSADSTLIFFGIRYSLTDTDDETWEAKADPRVQTSRRFGLDHWYGNMTIAEGSDGNFLFIGKRIAWIGFQNSFEVKLSTSELERQISDVTAKLLQAGFPEEPGLWI